MEQGSKKLVLVVVIVVCLGAAGVITFMQRSGGRDLSAFAGKKILLKCNNPDCGNMWEMDKKEYYEYVESHVDPQTHLADGVVCPKCGEKSGYRAVKCPKCGKVFFYGSVQSEYKDTCPDCGYSQEKEDRAAAAAKRSR